MRCVQIVALFLCAAGCNRHGGRDVSISQLVGTYEMRSAGQLDVIEIRDGTYRHTVTRSGRSSTQTAEWTAHRDDESLWISLSRFDTSGWPEEMPVAGQVLNYDAPVEIDRNRLTLVVSSDLGYRYVRN
jgi:hypothetical protein